jgi:chemotaxis protein MotB
MAIEEDSAPGVPEWVVTFGDMMSLLLTFFIMLVSMSEMKEDEKFQAMVESFREQFGHDLAPDSMVPGDNRPRGSALPHPVYSMGRSKRKDIKNGGQEIKAVVGDNERVQTVRPGEDATVGGLIFFEEDVSKLTEDNKRDLQRIIEQIAGKPQKVEIRGHTTRKPVEADSGFRDEWDLAFERGRQTMEFLVEQGIEPSRIRLSSAGAEEPLYNGVDPERLKRNSRVQILMWDERVEDLDGSARPPANQ